MTELTYALDATKFSDCKDGSFDWSVPALLKFCRDRGFNSSERKFASLCGATELEIKRYESGTVVLSSGVVPVAGLLVIEGMLSWKPPGEAKHLLGPGSVVGLAEGLAGAEMLDEITAETQAVVKEMPLFELQLGLEKTPNQLQSLFRVTIERILDDRFYSAGN